jgi:NitT/TauT family transport system substrate-binding protein
MEKSTSRPGRIRIAQAHQPIFYLPHLAAEAIGAFERRSITTELVLMETSDQWRVLNAGEADVAIGGPMRSMKLFEEGHRIVTFAAGVAASPWVLVGSTDAPIIDEPRALAGRTLFDDPQIATARLCVRGLLNRAEIGLPGLTISMRTHDELLAQVEAGDGALALLPMEAVAPALGRGSVRIVAELGRWTGPLPWSAYQVLPEVFERRQAEMVAFSEAIGEGLRAINEEPLQRLTRLVGPWFPSMGDAVLHAVLHAYREMGVWAATPLVSKTDFDRFASLLVAAGWLRAVPPYHQLVATPGG